MTELFRKHYSYGETIPILDTQVGTIVDIYEVTGKQASERPFIKAVFVATAGPMKSLPMVVEPLDNESKVIHLSNIPVPIPSVRTVDIALIFDVVNYRWTPSPDAPRDGGVVSFDLRCRAAFSMLGKSYTLLLDQRPCSITLTQTASGRQPTPDPAQFQRHVPTTQSEYVADGYGNEERTMSGQFNGGSGAAAATVTNQLDVEERLRQLSTKLLARS